MVDWVHNAKTQQIDKLNKLWSLHQWIINKEMSLHTNDNIVEDDVNLDSLSIENLNIWDDGK